MRNTVRNAHAACTGKTSAQAANEPRLTHQAAAVHVANLIYTEACATPDRAATLDDICDTLPEVLPQAFQATGTNPDLAAALLPAVTDRLWAYTAVEHGRAAAGHQHGYVFDLLVDGLRSGANPQTVRADACRIAKQLRTEHAKAGS
ncbi:hypothetical protein ACFYNZ_15210 [Streptomyces kebangsaanensis]|uniref:Uncharacterized protein n=1 Tax=Streptomyces kebangsaanensis TaxID=864058 RepID=A0ABW6KSH0_9ACTN